MTIQFSGVGSGLDYSSWIESLVAIKQESVTAVEEKIEAVESQQDAVSAIETQVLSLKSAVTKFTDANMFSSYDIFTRKNISATDDSVVSATASNSASIQNFTLEVSQLASATVATGVNELGAAADLSTKLTVLNNGVIDKGEASIYVDNQKYTFDVTADTDLSDFCDWIDGIVGTGSSTLDSDGNFSIDISSSTVSDIKFGSSSDESNLWDFFSFQTDYDTDDTTVIGYSSPKKITKIDNTKPLTSSESGLAGSVTEGTFTIGKKEFTIDSTTSLSGLIYQINSSSDAGVIANYDAVSNKLVLKSKEPGCTTINVEAGTSNFTEVVGLTTSTGEIAANSQELGLNAKFTINGKEFEAASNTITEATTGITGVTLNLKKVTDENEPVTLTIENDTTEVEEAITTFCSEYNELYDLIKDETSYGNDLYGDSSLNSILNDLANTIMNIVPGISTYKSLSAVGISTGSASTNTTDVPTALVFDSTRFKEAMNDNPDEVKKLFINVDSSDSSYNGVMVKLKDKITGYLDIEKGYFAIKEESFESQLESLNTSLERKQASVDAYEERLTKEFQEMDSYISELESASSYISSIGSSS